MLKTILKFISKIVLPETVVVGLDIQKSHVTAVARTTKYGNSTIVASGTFPFPEGTIVNGELKRPQELKRAIAEFVKKIPGLGGKIGSSNEPIFVLSIPPDHLYTETAAFPLMDDSDLAQSVKLKMETSMPWPREESYTDWNKVAIGEDKGMGAFIVGTSKPILDEYFKVFLENRWKVGACEFHLFSIARFIDKDRERPFIFVLIDDDGIEFAVYAFGGIISHYFESAEKAAHENDLIEDKVKQLKSYVESNFGAVIEKVFIFDRLQIQKTSEKFADVTGIPTQVFVPSGAPGGTDPQLLVASAAAQRPYVSDEPIMNLMPEALGGKYQENLFSKTMLLWVRIAALFIGVYLVALMGVYLVLVGEEGSLQARNNAFAMTLTGQEAQAAPLLTAAQNFNTLVDSVTTAERLRTDMGERLSAVLKEAQKDGLTFVSGRAGASGGILVVLGSPTRAAALAFQEAMQKNMLFSHIDIPLTDLAPDANLIINVTLSR